VNASAAWNPDTDPHLVAIGWEEKRVM